MCSQSIHNSLRAASPSASRGLAPFRVEPGVFFGGFFGGGGEVHGGNLITDLHTPICVRVNVSH